MRKLILLSLICASLNASAQHKRKTKTTYNQGTGMIVAGAISMGIGFLIPDGSEWTYENRYSPKVITKPFYMNPSRDICIGVGITLTIGGLWYNKNGR